MVNNIIEKGKKLLSSRQESVLSAATLIMVMIVASRILGLIRQRTLAHFFTPADLSLFFAAFRLPDLVFEVLVFGTFSSAFIPVFTKTLKKGDRVAWSVASSVVNIGLLTFIILAIIIAFWANPLYNIFAPGYSQVERLKITELTKILFAAQGFFVVSYVLTGVLESLRHFLIPALAPLFYNLGIIIGTMLFSRELGLLGPVIGVLIGAVAHFSVQLPLALKLGFRFRAKVELNEDVKKIGKLALPRIIEVSFLQISKLAELFFSSIISTASYAYYTFGNTLQLLPVGLFGTSIAKAALPTLSAQSENREEFTKTFLSSLNQLLFLSVPVATLLIVLRVPIVRLVYGTDIFDWKSTVQTGHVVSAFAIGVVFQAAISLLARGFYAVHDTKTPVKVSIASIILVIILDFIFIKVLFLPVWGLALAFSIGAIVQATVLFYLINKYVLKKPWKVLFIPLVKIIISSLSSGMVMFFFLKFFDRSVWVKQLSFIGKIDIVKTLTFQKFVLDTRYTFNLLILTVIVSTIGIVVYLMTSFLLRTQEVHVFLNLVRRTFLKRSVTPIPRQEQEPVVPTPSDSTE